MGDQDHDLAFGSKIADLVRGPLFGFGVRGNGVVDDDQDPAVAVAE